jgi:hypothetical protein
MLAVEYSKLNELRIIRETVSSPQFFNEVFRKNDQVQEHNGGTGA